MTTTTVLALKDKSDDLLFVPGDLAVLAAKHGTTIPTSLTGPDGTLTALPAGWVSAGEIDQKGAASITPDVKTSEILGYGSMVPRRTVKTAEGVSIDFTAQEVRRMNLGLFWGMNLDDVTPDATSGEWQVKKTAQAHMDFFSLILIAVDQNAAGDVFAYWIFPKVAVTKAGKIGFQMDGPQTSPITLTAYDDPDFGGYVAFGRAGLGNKALNAAAGFGTTTTKTFTLPGGTTGGTWTVTIDGTTSNLLSNLVTRASFESALEALVGEGNVTVTGTDALSGYTAVFRTTVTTVTASGASLTPSGTVTVA